jgi:phage repressor protein C with HTH and peptisase S24 domain
MRQNVRADLQPFASRLADAVERVGGISAVVRSTGRPRSSLDRWINAQAEPSATDLANVAEACGVSVDWLLSGRIQPVGETTSKSDAPNVVNIPILDVVAGAGEGLDNADPERIGEMPFAIAKLRELGIRPENVRAHEVRGDSMEPTIMDRAIVLVDTTKRDLVDGRTYSIRAPDGLRVKRIQRQIDGSVLLISDNRARYQPERVPAEDAMRISVLGRVFWSEQFL